MAGKNDLVDKARAGLTYIFDDLGHMLVFDEWSRERVQFKEHPFGLKDKVVHLFNDKIYFLGCPSYTDTSVSAMISHIRLVIAGNLTETARPLRMRMIFTERSGDLSVTHNVYFEISTSLGTFVCGGCNDYSGAGQLGKRKLEGVFSLLGLLYDMKIEKITLFYPESRALEKKLRDYINTTHTTRNEE